MMVSQVKIFWSYEGRPWLSCRLPIYREYTHGPSVFRGHSYMYHHLPFLYLEVKNKQTKDANVCVTKLFVEVKFSFILFSINEMNVPKNSSANFKETGCNVHVQCLTMFSLFPRQSWPARCQNNMNAKKTGISNLLAWLSERKQKLNV